MDIKNVIQNHGLKVQEVAKLMGVKQSTLSGLFTGNPTVETLHKIAQAVGCSVAEFFYDELPDGTIPHQSPADELPFEQKAEPQTQAVQQAIVCPHCGGAMVVEVKKIASQD